MLYLYCFIKDRGDNFIATFGVVYFGLFCLYELRFPHTLSDCKGIIGLEYPLGVFMLAGGKVFAFSFNLISQLILRSLTQKKVGNCLTFFSASFFTF